MEDKHKNELKQIKYKWEQFRKKNKFILMIAWTKQFKKLDKNTAEILYNFRNELNKYIILRCNNCEKDICTKCTSFGSTNLSSDIDITVNSGINISISLKHVLFILNDLKNIFKADKLFHTKNKFKLKNVHIFFDINFYISDFSIPKKHIDYTNINNFDSYIISTCYNNNCKKVINQYYFAFFEYIKKTKSNKLILIHSKRIREEVKITKELEKKFKNKYFDNIKINLISILTLYEYEGYHSQGAFFHVVMMIQKKIKFDIKNKQQKIIFKNLISASIIENLCFAYIHYNKKDKYLSRVNDGIEKLKEYNIKNKIFDKLKINNKQTINKSILTLFKILQINLTIIKSLKYYL